MSKDVLAAMPSSRLVGSTSGLIPGMQLAMRRRLDGGRPAGPGSIHGGRSDDSRPAQRRPVDHVDEQTAAAAAFMRERGRAQEVVVSTSGGLGETKTAA